MFAWKRGMAAIATVLLAATAVRADDAPAVIVGGSAREEAAPEEAHAVPNAMFPSLKGVPRGLLINDVDLLSMRSEYWLGVVVTRPSPALRAQLKLPKDQGLVVDVLQPDSPAAKAGLQQYDVLLKGNEKPLSSAGDLMQLIDQVKDGKLTLDLLRAGEHATVTVTPAKRPAHEPGGLGGPRLPLDAAVNGLTWNIDPNVLPPGGPLQFQIIRPGQILPPGNPVMGLPGGGLTAMEITVHAKTNLADGYKVEITRQGAEPARVVVARDKEKWEGTSNDLSKIPDKVRAEVEKLLHPAFDDPRVFRLPAGGGLVGSVTANGPLMTGAGSVAGGLANAAAVGSNVANRLSAMQKQIDELRQAVDALQNEVKKKSAEK